MKFKTIDREYINRHIYSNPNCTLDDVYNTYSKAKKYAFESCLEDKRSNNGYCGRIISHNTNIFTYGYLYSKGDKTIYVYITPTRREEYIVIDPDENR